MLTQNFPSLYSYITPTNIMIYKGKRLQTNGFITQLSDKLDVILKMQKPKIE